MGHLGRCKCFLPSQYPWQEELRVGHRGGHHSHTSPAHSASERCRDARPSHWFLLSFSCPVFTPQEYLLLCPSFPGQLQPCSTGMTQISLLGPLSIKPFIIGCGFSLTDSILSCEDIPGSKQPTEHCQPKEGRGPVDPDPIGTKDVRLQPTLQEPEFRTDPPLESFSGQLEEDNVE